MLKKLKLKNFQTHKNLEIEFDEITTIIGKSASGKTAVLRALNLIFNNKPSGVRYITHGEENSRVTLEVDGATVIRKRGKNLNKFFLDKKEYTAFGNDVPVDIKNLLNISELNVQKQLDYPLWFNLSPGEISKKLNLIVNLEEIDESLSFISTEVRKVGSELSICEDRIAEAEKKIKEYSWSESIFNKLKKLEEVENEIEKLKQELEELENLKKQINSKKIKTIKTINFKNTDILVKEVDKLKTELKSLNYIYKNITDLQKDKNSIQFELKELESKLATVKRCPLCGK